MMKSLSIALLLLFFLPLAASAACEDPQTQTEMNICAHQDFETADKKLNRVYAKHLPSLTKPHQTALRKAQRAWIKYRDLACKSYGLNAEGGSMQSMLVSNCLTKITHQRIKMLEDQFISY